MWWTLKITKMWRMKLERTLEHPRLQMNRKYQIVPQKRLEQRVGSAERNKMIMVTKVQHKAAGFAAIVEVRATILLGAK